jgi:hypothetical protein
LNSLDHIEKIYKFRTEFGMKNIGMGLDLGFPKNDRSSLTWDK